MGERWKTAARRRHDITRALALPDPSDSILDEVDLLGAGLRQCRIAEIVSFPEADTPPDLRRQVVVLQEQAWPPDHPRGLEQTHDPSLHPISMLLLDDGAVRVALDVLSKEIEHDGRRYRASGLSTVVTDRAHRGRGLAVALVEAARNAIAASGADLGIFTCDTPLAPFYERAGWEVLQGTVLVGGTPDDPLPSDRFDKVTLAAFFSARARLHAPSFVGRRVLLYPGTIDRLW